MSKGTDVAMFNKVHWLMTRPPKQEKECRVIGRDGVGLMRSWPSKEGLKAFVLCSRTIGTGIRVDRLRAKSYLTFLKGQCASEEFGLAAIDQICTCSPLFWKISMDPVFSLVVATHFFGCHLKKWWCMHIVVSSETELMMQVFFGSPSVHISFPALRYTLNAFSGKVSFNAQSGEGHGHGTFGNTAHMLAYLNSVSEHRMESLEFSLQIIHSGLLRANGFPVWLELKGE